MRFLTDIIFAGLFFVSLFFSFLTGRGYVLPFPSAAEIPSFMDSGMGDVFFLSLGMRRLAADIWFIRLLQYYGAQEEEGADADNADRGHDERDNHHHHNYDGGNYPEMLPRASHILALDPYFTHACLYAAGALAFNLNKPEEAVELIGRVKKYNPKEWKYDSYLAAIGYKAAKNPEKVADMITPVVNDPDCPTMIKQLAAFLNKRVKRYKTAAEIYRNIIAVSPEQAYVENARRELKKLEQGAI